MRRISANYIFPINQLPIKNGIIEIDEQGQIINIIDTKGNLRESRQLEYYNGVIVPGFINSHCHLELSEHKSKIDQKLGLHNFLESVFKLKQQDRSTKTSQSIKNYDRLMQQNGIVAVGDICNSDKSVQVKKESKIYYHNFIEALGFGIAEKIIELNQGLCNIFNSNGLINSIVPHAPYSVSEDLFIAIKQIAENEEAIVSIHNQETISENEMFQNKSGQLYDKLKSLGVNYSSFKATGVNSVQSISQFLPKDNNIIFVHNTYSTKEDIEFINKQFQNAFWCLCPNSNLYIENKLPEIQLFSKMQNKVILGTDSLASNTTLSILDEMKTIIEYYPKIEFDNLLQWATINGARALKIDDLYGSIEIGKSPGLNLISNFDFENMQLTVNSQVKALVS